MGQGQFSWDSVAWMWAACFAGIKQLGPKELGKGNQFSCKTIVSESSALCWIWKCRVAWRAFLVKTEPRAFQSLLPRKYLGRLP